MKKSAPHKLALRRETLRALSEIDLERAVGGDAVALLQTGDKVCTGLAVAVVSSQVVGGACAAG
jgi:hypothetical protein